MADEPFLTRWSFQVPILYLSLCLVTEKIWGGSEIEVLNRNFFYHCEASTKLRLVILFVSENFRSFLLPPQPEDYDDFYCVQIGSYYHFSCSYFVLIYVST